MISLRSALQCTDAFFLAESVSWGYVGVSTRDMLFGGKYMTAGLWSLRAKLSAIGEKHIDITYIVCGPVTIASDLATAGLESLAERVFGVAEIANDVFVQNLGLVFGRVTMLEIADQLIPNKFLRIKESDVETSGTFFFNQFPLAKWFLVGDVPKKFQITVFLVPSYYTIGQAYEVNDAPIWLQMGRQFNGNPPWPIDLTGVALAHEFGHALGLKHPDEEKFVENYVKNDCATCPPNAGKADATCLACNLMNGGGATEVVWLTPKQITRVMSSRYMRPACA